MVFLFGSCLKDENLRTYTIYKPVYGTAQQVQDNIKTKPARAVENMGSFLVYKDYLLAIEKIRGVHIYDIGNKSNPVRVGFIPIPGCLGIAIRDNNLYANSYMDLLVIDINDIQQAKFLSVTEDVFKSERYRYGPAMSNDSIVVDWIKKDTMVTQEYIGDRISWGGGFFETMANSNASVSISSDVKSSESSTGGSMARFILVNNFMYAVDQSHLYSFDISNPSSPQQTNDQNVGWSIETIYPFKDKLFIGSSNGMFIYTIENPSNPTKQSSFSHVSSCDPVVADDDYAYVTLRSGTACQGFTNQMEILDVKNITAPKLLKTYSYTNPHGLSKSGNTIFLCDGKAGLRILDATNPLSIKQKKRFRNIGTAIDVITIDNIAYVITRDNVLIYEFSSYNDVKRIGSISK